MDTRLRSITTPLHIPAWRKHLQKHPDKDYVHYILQGIEHGFNIGIDQDRAFKSAHANMQSARQNPQVVEDYLRKEVAEGNMLGPFPIMSAPAVLINRMGVIPKKHQKNKWRIITDLSHPEGHSVNDAIDSLLCSMSYITVDQVAARAMSLGKGALIAKIDIKSAYRLVPVHPSDRKWLGVKWNDHIYVDGSLPFGLRSAPKIFTALADAVEWCVAATGVPDIYHYLDDFAVLGPPRSEACCHNLSKLKMVCGELGIPLAPEKEEGPSTSLTFLGIVIDTTLGELRLPEDKLQRLLQTVRDWESRKSCSRAELESLIGVLQHATKVIQPGRSFLRRAIKLLSVAKQHHHHIRLNAEFKADLAWWRVFASHWNGASLLVHKDSDMSSVTSDASGNWGCGAWHEDEWFQIEWDQHTRELHIAAKELIPIIIAAIIWGPKWEGQKVDAYCDNMAVVAAVTSRYCQDATLMQMLWGLFFIEAHYQFKISATHIPGQHNELADDLSRNRLVDFLRKKTGALPTASNVPVSFLQWLLNPKLEWTSQAWMRQFATFVRKE